MTTQYQSILDWLDKQSPVMTDMLSRLVRINSHSLNLTGLKNFSRELEELLQVFETKVEHVDLPDWESIGPDGKAVSRSLGQALCLRKRPDAPRQLFFMIHMDTVYSPDTHSFDVQMKNNRLIGPGVADAKGGLVVMLKALEAFECAPVKNEIGWTMLLNPDEEIGSPGTKHILPSLLNGIETAILFEPSLPNGDLVGARKGSGNFTLFAKGKAAHAGRNPQDGKNAVTALAEAVVKIDSLNGSRPGLTVNVGVIEGGTAVNVVPDRAAVHFNVRLEHKQDAEFFSREVETMIRDLSAARGVELRLHGGLSAPPKEMDEPTIAVYQHIRQCGEELGLSLNWQPSGGVSDGNRIAALGIPTVDTLGVRGGSIHSEDEYCHIDSLTERAKLTTLYLLKLASGEFD